MERFVSLRQFQQKAEDSLERVRRNPITLRAMSDLSANAESENVLVEVARRRADNFSHDSEDCNAALRDFETQMSAYFRLAFLTLEISMEAPLPELGRPAALQKNLWIFFKSVCDCEELKVFQSDNSGKTVHSEICKKVDEIMRVFLAAQNKLDRLYHDLEQPMNIEPLFTNSGCETNYLNNQEKIA